MPIFIAALLGGLASMAGSLVGRVLISLGIGYVTYQGIDILLDVIKDDVFNAAASLPTELIQIMGLLQVGTCINMLFSAVSVRLVLNGITSGSITKMKINS